MKTTISLILAAAFTGLVFAQSPETMPVPGPEARELAVWYGQWSYTGEVFASPLGPAGKVTGMMTGRPIQNGFAGEFIYDENGPAGAARYHEIDFWDPATKCHAYIVVGTDGYAERGSFWMKGAVTIWETTVVANEKTFKVRGTETVAADGQSYTKMAKVSADGKNWQPLSETMYRRRSTTLPALVSADQELIALERAWAAAYVAADVKALALLEADDWICTTADGQVLSKADDIRDIADGSFKATVFEMSDLKVQLYGDTAVITGRQTEKATYKGKDASATHRVTDVWLRRDGRWQAIASHLSKASPALEEAAVKHEVAQTMQGLLGAFSRADIDGILSFYADDPEFRAIEPDGKVSAGAAFRKSTREFFAGVASESIQTRTQDIRLVDPDTAILTWNGGFQTRLKDGTTLDCDSYGATFVFHRIGKDWKIIHDHESGVPPQPVQPIDTTKAVLRMLDDYFAAVNARDPAKFLTFFSETEDVTAFEDKDLRTSRKELAAFVDGFFKDVSQIQATWEQRMVHELTPTTAVVTGTFKVEAKDAKGSPMAFRNAFTFVLVNQGDRWLVKHVHESSLSPEPEKP